MNIILQEQGYPCDLMVKALDSGIVGSEFELQLCYYIHFQTNTLGKSMNHSPSPPSYGLDNITTVQLEEWLWHYITYDGWYVIKNKETKPNQTYKNFLSVNMLTVYLTER